MFNFPGRQEGHKQSFAEIKIDMAAHPVDFNLAERTVHDLHRAIGKKPKDNTGIFEELEGTESRFALDIKTQQENIVFVTAMIANDPKYSRLNELKTLIEKKYPGQYQSLISDLDYYKDKRKNKTSQDLLKYWKSSSENTKKYLENVRKQIRLMRGLETTYGISNQETMEAVLFGVQQGEIITRDIIKNIFSFQKLEKSEHKKTFIEKRRATGLETNPEGAVKKLQMIRDFEVSFCDKKINELNTLKASSPTKQNEIDIDIRHYQKSRTDKENYFSKLIIGIHSLSNQGLINDNLIILKEKKVKGKKLDLIEKANKELEKFSKYNDESLQHIKNKYNKFTSFLNSAGENLAKNNTDLTKQLYFFDYQKNQKGIKMRGDELKEIFTKLQEYKKYFSNPGSEKEKKEKIAECENYLEKIEPVLKIKALNIIINNYVNGTEAHSAIDKTIENAKNLSELKKFLTERINSKGLALKTIGEIKKKKKKH